LESDFEEDSDDDGGKARKKAKHANKSNECRSGSGRVCKQPQNFAKEQAKQQMEEEQRRRRVKTFAIKSILSNGFAMFDAPEIQQPIQDDLQKRFVPLMQYEDTSMPQFSVSCPAKSSSWFTTKQKQQCSKCGGFFTVNASGKMHKHSCDKPVFPMPVMNYCM
jgi:hypothetical protein